VPTENGCPYLFYGVGHRQPRAADAMRGGCLWSGTRNEGAAAAHRARSERARSEAVEKAAELPTPGRDIASCVTLRSLSLLDAMP